MPKIRGFVRRLKCGLLPTTICYHSKGASVSPWRGWLEVNGKEIAFFTNAGDLCFDW